MLNPKSPEGWAFCRKSDWNQTDQLVTWGLTTLAPASGRSLCGWEVQNDPQSVRQTLGQPFFPLRASQSTFSPLRQTATGPFAPTFFVKLRLRSGLRRSPLSRGSVLTTLPMSCFVCLSATSRRICVRDVCLLKTSDGPCPLSACGTPASVHLTASATRARRRADRSRAERWLSRRLHFSLDGTLHEIDEAIPPSVT
jgi:hypothetical protein